MNVGRAITAACRDQRTRDFLNLYRNASMADRNRLLAYWWWGWDICGPGGIGRPGADL